jgi:tRNA threonylcarbamoyladenosine biosynthesis protein TsaB
MLTLVLRTDKPESEIGLFEDGKQLVYDHWQAHRQLAETIHKKIRDMLEAQGRDLSDITAVAVYQGPGSFTGLRIGISVANALAMSYQLPIIGKTGEQWLDEALASLSRGESDETVVPEYGADVHITQQKK